MGLGQKGKRKWVSLSVDLETPDRDPGHDTIVNARLVSWGVKTVYGGLALLTLVSVLFTLIPYYLSGYEGLSVEQIEYSNMWLWEYEAYPLYGWGGQVLAGFVMIWPIIGVALLIGAIAELIVRWRKASLQGRLGRMAIVAASAATFAAVMMADKLVYLVSD